MSVKRKKKRNIRALLLRELSSLSLITPHLIVFSVFFLFPFVFGIIISLFNWNLYIPSKTVFVGLQNFYNILFNKESIFYTYFWEGLGNTLLFVVVSVPLLVGIPLGIALLLDQKPWGYRFFSAILFMPTVFSISAVILMWRWMFYQENGFINSVLMSLGMKEPIPFLSSQPWAWIAIIVVTIWWTMGTNMVILHAGMKNVNRAMYEAASTDGASYLTTVIKITIPSLSNQMLIVFIMTILASFNIYGQPLLLTGGNPDRTTYVLMMRIRDWATGGSARPGIATAMALSMGVIMIIVSLAQTIINTIRERR